MARLRSLAIVILLLSYGAVGARQPAIRGSIPLPVPADKIATALGLDSADRATLLLRAIRLVFDAPDGQSPQGRKVKDALRAALSDAGAKPGPRQLVPLPLDPSIWRDTILQAQVPDDQLVAAILSDRRYALLYHGLAAMDDATLAWLGPERDMLSHLKKHPAVFAAFGRSIHVGAGRILVPGGTGAEPLWKALSGADPAKPATFVQKVFRDDGRLAFFYDTVAHLDPARQRFVLGMNFRDSSRDDRLRAVLDAFALSAPEWRVQDRPFTRPLLDGAMVFSTVRVTPEGEPAAPLARRIWERVFREDELNDVPFNGVSQGDLQLVSGAIPVDASWLAGRLLRVPYLQGRKRLDALLFAQRVFADTTPAQAADVASAARAFIAMPALSLSLERTGFSDPAIFVRAAQHAATLSDLDALPERRNAIVEFQAAVTVIEHAHRSGLLNLPAATTLVDTLCALEVTPRGYGSAFPRWIHDQLAPALSADSGAPIEQVVLEALAGVRHSAAPAIVVEWEGSKYRVDPGASELRRLREVREHQGGLSLDGALSASLATEPDAGAEPLPRRAKSDKGEQHLADALISIVYAVHLGDPDGPAVTSGNVALRHDLGLSDLTSAGRSSAAWRLPVEHFAGKALRISGAILGLETAMGRLAMRRLDPTAMPAEPKLPTQDQQALMLATALQYPAGMSDAARDEIAASIARGRAKALALSADPAEIDKAAREAGLSEWRRQALAWTLSEDRDHVLSQFSLPELFWLGGPRHSAVQAGAAWGATPLPLTGCLCLEMPDARAWEETSGRTAAALLATRAADVPLRVADTLAALKLPAALAPGVSAYAVQDVIDRAQPAYPDDWDAFARAALGLPRERFVDYIAALTARGPLVPLDEPTGKQ